MLDQKRMNQFRENGADAALKLRGELVTALQDRITGTLQAVNEYFASRRKSETAIADRIEALKGQKAELEAAVADYAPRLANATISGDSDTLEEIQTQLTGLEARKAATTAQIELLSGVAVTGDETLFNEANEKALALAAFWSSTQADLSSLSAFASEQITTWAKVAKVSDLGGDILPRKSVFDRVREMQEDFTKGSARNE